MYLAWKQSADSRSIISEIAVARASGRGYPSARWRPDVLDTVKRADAPTCSLFAGAFSVLKLFDGAILNGPLSLLLRFSFFFRGHDYVPMLSRGYSPDVAIARKLACLSPLPVRFLIVLGFFRVCYRRCLR